MSKISTSESGMSFTVFKYSNSEKNLVLYKKKNKTVLNLVGSLAPPRETLRVSGKQNSLFYLGPIMKIAVTRYNICLRISELG